MTAPRAAIVFNNSTGSDTAASGLGPATAITGTAAAHTNGSASTTITLTNTPDLSGIQTGDLLWLATSSGRQFSIIASVDDVAKTVTVDDSFNIDSGSAVDFAIGGKRASLTGSSTLFSSDAKAGWTLDVEYTGITYTHNSPITINVSGNATDGFITLKSSSSTRPHISYPTASNGHNLFTVDGLYWRFENLEMSIASNVSQSGQWVLYYNVSTTNRGFSTVKNCYLHGLGQNISSVGGINHSANVGNVLTVEGCVLVGTRIRQAFHRPNNGGLANTIRLLNNVFIIQPGASGTNVVTLGNEVGTIVQGNIFINYGAATQGLSITGGSRYTIIGNTIHGMGSDGIRFSAVSQLEQLVCYNNNITGNGGYGINLTSGTAHPSETDIHHNNFGSGTTLNTSGSVNGVTLGEDNVNIDPEYVNAANGDFTPQNIALKGIAWPQSVNGIVNDQWIGAIQPYMPTPDEIKEAMWTWYERTLTA
jgi:hypothetical protein